MLMVDRPNHMDSCSVEEQVRRAQDLGALTVLIVNERCSSFNSACRIEAREFASQNERKSSTASIPALLIYKEDAAAIKSVLRKGQQVVVSISFAIPAPDDRVEYDLWMTPMDPDASTFLSTFQMAASVWGDHVFFTPHMIVNRCPVGSEGRWRYCDPYFESKVMTEMDSVLESLRRICIWRAHGSDGYGQKWWDYASDFSHTCPGKLARREQTLEECAHLTMARNSVDVEAIKTCIESSGGQLEQAEHLPNDLLEEAVESANQDGKPMDHASLYVNEVKIYGRLSFDSAFQGICSGFADSSVPDVCVECINQRGSTQSCVSGYKQKHSQLPTNPQPSVSVSKFFAAMLWLVTLLGISTYVYVRRNMRFVHSHVHEIVAEYLPLSEASDVVQ